MQTITPLSPTPYSELFYDLESAPFRYSDMEFDELGDEVKFLARTPDGIRPFVVYARVPLGSVGTGARCIEAEIICDADERGRNQL